MKGREVREALNGNADPKIIHCIASVAEELSALGQEMNALAQLLNQMTDVMGGMTETIEAVKNAVTVKHDI